MKKSLPNIFEYIDFRKYLEDYRIARKKYNEGFTHTYICFKLGQRNARSYFRNIVCGKRAVTPNFIDRFIELLELNAKEAKYFRALVSYNQATSAHEKEFYFDQIIQLNQTPKKLIGPKEYIYFKEWYHSVIRAVLDIYDFKGNYRELKKKIYPPITVKEAKHSIKLMTELKLIEKNENGCFKPTSKVITTGDNIRNHLIQQYQLRSLEIAKEAIVNNEKQQAKMTTLTMSLSDNALNKIKHRLQQFRSEVKSIVHKDEEPAVKVYQINIQAFPHSQ